MWEFATTDHNITQQLAALVAIVAIAIIGVAVLLVPPTWKGLKNKSAFLSVVKKRAINKLLFYIIVPVFLFVFITEIVGTYFPSWIQTVTISYPLLIIVFILFHTLFFKIIKKEEEEQPHPKLELLPFLYKNAFIWIISCIFFCLLALLGVATTMFNIEIGPFSKDNYNWARWALLDGIFFFFLGLFYFSIIYIKLKIKVKKQSNSVKKQKPKKTSAIIFVIIVCLLLAFIFTTQPISTLFSIPLDVNPSIKFTGTQFIITNINDFDWENITFSINKEELSSGYNYSYGNLAQNETLTVDAREFSSFEGMRFDTLTMKLIRFSIDVHNSSGQSGTFSGIYTPNEESLSMPLDVKASINFNGIQFKITNHSDFDWENITFSIDKDGLSSGYILFHQSLKQGETYTVNAKEFANNNGLRFDPITMKSSLFSIDVYNSTGQFGTYTGYLK